MMNFHIDGLDRLSVSYASLSQISEDDLWAIIEPAANTLKDKMQETISALFTQRSNSLHDSIEVKRKLSKGGVVYALVGPNQKKHPKSTTGKRHRRDRVATKRKPRTGTAGSYAGTNAEVGWILEYGSTRIHAKHWMEQAVTDTEEELLGQLETGFNAYLDAAGL